MDLNERRKLMFAKEAFNSLCVALDKINFKYNKDEDNLTVTFGVAGDDLPINLFIKIDVERQLVRLMSFLPFKVKSDKCIDMAVATCAINYILADGSFDVDICEDNGSVIFRMTTCFRESILDSQALEYLFSVATFTIDKYNDMLNNLNDGRISLSEFINKLD